MFKLSNFDNSEIAQIKPNQLRVRLTLDDPIKLAKQTLRLQLKFEFSDSSNRAFEFQLEPIGKSKEASSSSWFGSKKQRRIYEFKLSKIAQLEFSNFQKNLIERKEIEKYFWTVFYYLAPHDESDAKIDVELKFSNQDKYFFLLKGAKVKIEVKN